jgi:muramoyltetrapeptide carboxypeptidase
MQFVKPKALRRGDTIGVVVPAGPLDRERIDRALDRVRQRGFRIKTYGDIYRSQGYLAGDDATRATEFMAAFADRETTAVWCARGGYGVARLLDFIDFDVIRRNPKVFVGFSDISILHAAIQQRTGLITFHGPNLQDGFGKHDDMLLATEAALWRAILADQQAGDVGYQIETREAYDADARTIVKGTATGRLTGGNLAVICGLMGTPFELETTDRILFLEDVSERVYRIDRYLAQLSLAGKLQSAAGILLGTYSYEDDEPADSQAAVASLLDEYCSDLKIPVLAGFPTGHAQYNLTLPMGAFVEMDAVGRCVRVLENPVTP